MTTETAEILEAAEEVAAVTETAPQNEDTAASAEEKEADEKEGTVDYSELLRSDMAELAAEFSPKENIKITDLKNPVRYGALRDLGLTPREAYLASGGRKEKSDNRAHLSSSVPRAVSSSFSEIPRAELDAARELFADMSDSEIRNLYKKVTQ